MHCFQIFNYTKLELNYEKTEDPEETKKKQRRKEEVEEE